MAREWDGVLRVSVITGVEHIPALHPAVAQRMGARVRTVDTFFPDWDFWIFEVLDRSCSKSNAIAFLCAGRGVESRCETHCSESRKPRTT